MTDNEIERGGVMFKLVDWEQFFKNAESNNEPPCVAQVNQNGTMVGWTLFNNGNINEILSDDGLVQVWGSIDTLIGQTFQEFGLYGDIHVYYGCQNQIDLNENIVIDFQKSVNSVKL